MLRHVKLRLSHIEPPTQHEVSLQKMFHLNGSIMVDIFTPVACQILPSRCLEQDLGCILSRNRMKQGKHRSLVPLRGAFAYHKISQTNPNHVIRMRHGPSCRGKQWETVGNSSLRDTEFECLKDTGGEIGAPLLAWADALRLGGGYRHA